MENNHENEELDLTNEEMEEDFDLDLDTTDDEEEAPAQNNNNNEQSKRLEKAERLIVELKKQLKEVKAEPKVTAKPKAPVKAVDPYFEERLELLATGVSREEIQQATIIAKGLGSTLTDAMENETFQVWREKKQEEKREQRAKLGASRGAGAGIPKLDIKPGMSREQHEQAWKKANGIG